MDGSGGGNKREMTPGRVEKLQKRASMFGCALYLAAVLVLGGIFLYHILRG